MIQLSKSHANPAHSASNETTPAIFFIMAAASGIAVANLYYNQPLLAMIAREFQSDASEVGFIPMLTQVGYAIGLLIFVPLGDRFERRGLIVVLLLAVALALCGAAVATSIAWLALSSLIIGVTTVAPQLIIPFAARLAPPETRGKMLGIVISGLLIGILLARTFSGFIAAQISWRAVFWIAAALSAALALVLLKALPRSPGSAALSYGGLLRSIWQLARNKAQLREASFIGAALFAAFSTFWTTLVFFLTTPPYHYGSRAAGLFGLVGAAGASAAPIAGRLADRRGPRYVVGVATLITLAAFVVFRALGTTLWGLVLGVILLDLGVQAAGVSNQARIYTLAHGAESRVNTVYMVTYFIGGSIGSIASARVWHAWQWTGVCALGFGFTALALAVHIAAVRSGPK